MEQNEDEILPEAKFYAFRAENLFKRKMEALEEMWSKPPKAPSDEEDTKLVSDKRTTKKRRGGKKPSKDVSELDIESNTDDDSEDYLMASPPKKTTRSRRKAKIDNEKSVGSANLIPSVKLPAAAKRRIQEVKLKSLREQKRIEMENDRILSACYAISKEVEPLPVEEIESEQNIIIKVKYLSNISKLTVKMTDKFASIYNKVAEINNLESSEILLCTEDQTAKLTDTPLSLNLKNFDVLDCFPYKPSDHMLGNNGTKFCLKMQSNDIRKKLEVYGSKLEKLKVFMKRYSEMRNIPLEKLTFKFDGEIIEDSDTPEDLEMESGSCIDVKVRVETSKVIPEPDFEVTAEFISTPNMLQVCVLD